MRAWYCGNLAAINDVLHVHPQPNLICIYQYLHPNPDPHLNMRRLITSQCGNEVCVPCVPVRVGVYACVLASQVLVLFTLKPKVVGI